MLAAAQEVNSRPRTSVNKRPKCHGKSNSINKETIITITNTININNKDRMQLGI